MYVRCVCVSVCLGGMAVQEDELFCEKVCVHVCIVSFAGVMLWCQGQRDGIERR